MRLALLTCLLALGLCAPAGAAWTRLGDNVNVDPAANGSPTALADVGGLPVMVRTEGTRVHVSRWDGAAWAQLGAGTNPVFPSSVASQSGSVADVGGQPWVALADQAGSAQPLLARVARWDGTAWQPVGNFLNLTPGANADRTVIASAAGTPHVAWTENGDLYARRLQGAAWGPVTPGFRRISANTTVTDTAMATIGGVPYLAWLETTTGTSEYRIFVARFNGAAWEDYGPHDAPVNAVTTAAVSDLDIAGLGNDAHVIFNQGADGVRVMRFNGAAWTQVGGALNVGAGSTGVAVSLSPFGSTLHAAWSENEGAARQVRTRQLDPATGVWSEIGASGSINNSASGVAGTVHNATVAGVPWLAWGEQPGDGGAVASRAARLDPDWGVALPASSVTTTSAVVEADLNAFGVALPLVARFGAGGAFDRVTAPQSAPGAGRPAFALTGLAPSTTYTWRVEVSDGTRTSASSPNAGSFTTAPVAQATPTVTPTPTAVPTPVPELRKAAVARVTRGTVLVRLPGTKVFIELGEAPARLPVGTEVDARDGRVALTFVRPGNVVQTATFYAGRFKIASQAADGMVRLVLQGKFATCRAKGSVVASAAAKRRKKKALRRLWGDGAGRFTTTGKYAAAVVRGTKWLTEDYCDATKVSVSRGRVDVRDLVRKRTVKLRPGRSYLARAP